MEAQLQRIFEEGFDRYAKERCLPLKAYKAAEAIRSCRTAKLGGHLQSCPEGHVTRIHYNSCKHRSCPRCAALPRARWVESQQSRLLSCDHFHAIFTMPHELQPLWLRNQRWFTDALFQSCRDTLMELLTDNKYLGATPGILMSLHTWGRSLVLHPHIHCLITGGGLEERSGQWKRSREDFLLPVRVVKALYKGKLLSKLWDALNGGELKLPPDQSTQSIGRMLKQINRKPWNVRLKERYSHGRGVMLYLSRYVKGGAISDRRIVSCDEKKVTFRYKDHRDGGNKLLRLKPDEFIQRILWHVPESGQHSIRHYGLYAHQAKNRRAICREQLGQEEETRSAGILSWQEFMTRLGNADQGCCPTCGKQLIQTMRLSGSKKQRQISIAERPLHGYVQQGVRADRGKAGSGPSKSQERIFLSGERPLN